eukprot:5850742-Pleurochrysis_carterae.AAC.2
MEHLASTCTAIDTPIVEWHRHYAWGLRAETLSPQVAAEPEDQPRRRRPHRWRRGGGLPKATWKRRAGRDIELSLHGKFRTPYSVDFQVGHFGEFVVSASYAIQKIHRLRDIPSGFRYLYPWYSGQKRPRRRRSRQGRGLTKRGSPVASSRVKEWMERARPGRAGGRQGVASSNVWKHSQEARAR